MFTSWHLRILFLLSFIFSCWAALFANALLIRLTHFRIIILSRKHFSSIAKKKELNQGCCRSCKCLWILKQKEVPQSGKKEQTNHFPFQITDFCSSTTQNKTKQKELISQHLSIWQKTTFSALNQIGDYILKNIFYFPPQKSYFFRLQIYAQKKCE